MTDENFDKKMEDWAADAARSAPELRPTDEMYSLVEAKGRRGISSWFWPRRLAARTAFVILAFLILGTLTLSDPATWFEPAPSHQVAFVEQRTGPNIQPEPPEKGKGGGHPSFQHLILQRHHGVNKTITSFDLQSPLTKSITLTPGDGVRLLLQPAGAHYLYIYLLNPNNEVMVIHPEAGFNPLPPGTPTLLPAKPDWFYLSGESGAYHLQLVTAPHAIPELDQLYSQYLQQSTDPGFEPAHSALSEYLHAITTDTPEDFEVWELTINLQDE